MTDDEPMNDCLQNPEHWRARAEETREKANVMGSLDFKERMLQIAFEYDRLAEWVTGLIQSRTDDSPPGE